jgi:hypothetical protein
MRTGLGLGAWALLVAWLVLLITGHRSAAGWCVLAAGVSVLVAAPLYRREPATRMTGLVMLGAGVFFAALGVVYLAT